MKPPHFEFILRMRKRLQLPQGGARQISLDELGDAIGLDYAHPAEIDALINDLEEEGYQFKDGLGDQLITTLRAVLLQARELKALGQGAGIADIARALGRSERAVRVALLYGEVLGSGS